MKPRATILSLSLALLVSACNSTTSQNPPPAPSPVATVQPPIGSPDGKGLTPGDLQSAYKLSYVSAHYGAAASSPRALAETVAVLAGGDDPNAEADMAVYRTQFSLPPCTSASGCFRRVNQRRTPIPPGAPSGKWGQQGNPAPGV